MKPSSDPKASRILGIRAKEMFMSLQCALGRAGAGEVGMLQTMLEWWLYGTERGRGGSAERSALLLASHQDHSGLVCFIL